MPARQHRRDAARAGIAKLVRLEQVGGFAVRRIGQPFADQLAVAAFVLVGDPLEKRLGRRVDHRREAIFLDLLERSGERVDGIVGPRLRAVPALVHRGQLEVGIGLLGDLHVERVEPAVLVHRAAAGIAVQAHIRRRSGCAIRSRRGARRCRSVSSSPVNRTMMSRVGWKPAALRFCSARTIAGQRRLIVVGPAPEIIALLLAELERRVLPV